jgi:hypothetical protein
MSRKRFAVWEEFIDKLEQEAFGDSPNADAHPDVRAQQATAAIRNRNTSQDFWNIIRRCLRGSSPDSGIPAQTVALAEIFWPLTVSTNYDHLFYRACRQVSEDRLPPAVLGRSAEDCSSGRRQGRQGHVQQLVSVSLSKPASNAERPWSDGPRKDTSGHRYRVRIGVDLYAG